MINNNLNNNNNLDILLNSPKSPKSPNLTTSSPLTPNSPSKRKRPQEIRNINPRIKKKLNFDNEIIEISDEAFESMNKFSSENTLDNKICIRIKVEDNIENDKFNDRTIFINKIFMESFGLKYFKQENEIYQLNHNIHEIFDDHYLSSLTEEKIECIIDLLRKINFNFDTKLNSLTVTKENFTSLLLFSKKSFNYELLKKCIKFKCSQSNDLIINISLTNDKFYFVITIKNLKHYPLIKQLSHYFDKNIEIHFSSEENLNKRYLRNFALEFGDKIKELQLSNRKTIKTLLSHCINAKKIYLHNNSMITEELLCINEMKDLHTLNIIRCNRIKELPNLQQLKNLNNLILFCDNLQKISFLPNSLRYFDLKSSHIATKDLFVSFLSILTKENISEIDIRNFKLSNNSLDDFNQLYHLSLILQSIKSNPLFFILEKFSYESRFEFYYLIFEQKINYKMHNLILEVIEFFVDDNINYLNSFLKELINNYINNPVNEIEKINLNQVIKNAELTEFVNQKLTKPTMQEFIFAYHYKIDIPLDYNVSKFFNHSLVKDNLTISRKNNKILNYTLKTINFLLTNNIFKKKVLEIIQTEIGIKFIANPIIRKRIFTQNLFKELICEIYPLSKLENSQFYPIHFNEALSVTGEIYLVTELSFYHLNQETLFTLSELSSNIKKFFNDKLFIRFFDRPAFDGGGEGINRECFNHLFKKISEYYSLRTNIPQFSIKNEKYFYHLGSLLYLLFRNVTVILDNDKKDQLMIPDYPVGPIVKENFFEGLYLFTKEELGRSFSNISLERIFEICSHFCAKDPQFISMNQFLNWNESESNHLMIDYVSELISLEMLDRPPEMNEQDEKINFDLLIKYKSYFKDTIKSDYIHTQKGQLQTLFSIAKGMTLNPFFKEDFWDLTNPTILKNIIVGKEFCRKTLKKSLQFKNVPQDFQEFFNDFVDKESEVDVKHFLTFATGSETLPFKNIIIKIDPFLNGDQVRVMTCFNFIDIPENLTLEQLKINIQHSIEEIKKKQS